MDVLSRLRRAGAKYRKQKQAADQVRRDLYDAILEADKAGLSSRTIAEAMDNAVSWRRVVQIVEEHGGGK